jgi:hypothetical protein
MLATRLDTAIAALVIVVAGANVTAAADWPAISNALLTLLTHVKTMFS